MNKVNKFVELVNKAVNLAEELDKKEQELELISEEIKYIVLYDLEYLEGKELTKEIEKVLNKKAK